MKKIRLWVMLVLSLGWVGAAGAFELNVCQTTGNWKPMFGNCDGKGQLQGQGAAYFFNMFIFGEFVDGQPHGEQTVFVRDAIGKYFGDSARSKFSSLADIASALGDNKYRTDSCRVQFNAGVVVARDIVCTVGYRNKPTVMTVTPFDGKVRIEVIKGRAFLVADMPALQIRGKFDRYSYITSLMEGFVGTFKGKADSVTIGGEGQMVRNITLSGSNAAGTLVSDDAAVSARMTGHFDVKCNVSDCSVSPLILPSLSTQVEEKYLLALEINGKRYEVVPLGFSYHDHGVYYFKSPEGLVFDGTPAVCSVPANGRPQMGKARIVIRGSKQSTTLDIEPLCGKVTMPNGQSYTGKFVDGRPVTQ